MTIKYKPVQAKEIVIRNVPPVPRPQFAVVEIDADNIGTDKAWFFSENDARQYQHFLEVWSGESV